MHGSFYIVLIALGISLALRPWRMLRGGALLTPVLATLVANRKSLAMPLAAVITDLIPEVADLTGALPVSVADLRAGYLPAGHLGHATRWVTDGARTWIEPHPPLVGTT